MAIHLIDFKENNGGRKKSPMMFLQALFISAVKIVVHSSHISPQEGIGVGGGRQHKPNRQAVRNYTAYFLVHLALVYKKWSLGK